VPSLSLSTPSERKNALTKQNNLRNYINEASFLLVDAGMLLQRGRYGGLEGRPIATDASPFPFRRITPPLKNYLRRVL
jgi:hypothetical protein